VARLVEAHGDAKLTELPVTLTNCPRRGPRASTVAAGLFMRGLGLARLPLDAAPIFGRMLTISISAEAFEAIAATLADGYELRPARTARATIWPALRGSTARHVPTGCRSAAAPRQQAP
jgi:hypothetical protein